LGKDFEYPQCKWRTFAPQVLRTIDFIEINFKKIMSENHWNFQAVVVKYFLVPRNLCLKDITEIRCKNKWTLINISFS